MDKILFGVLWRRPFVKVVGTYTTLLGLALNWLEKAPCDKPNWFHVYSWTVTSKDSDFPYKAWRRRNFGKALAVTPPLQHRFLDFLAMNERTWLRYFHEDFEDDTHFIKLCLLCTYHIYTNFLGRYLLFYSTKWRMVLFFLCVNKLYEYLFVCFAIACAVCNDVGLEKKSTEEQHMTDFIIISNAARSNVYLLVHRFINSLVFRLPSRYPYR